MKKLLAATAISALIATHSFAGEANMSPPPSRTIEEPEVMGNGMNLLIPLLAIGLLVYALSNNSPAPPSDIRLKTDIEPMGIAPNGLPLYSFRYIGGTETYLGVMAQDVLSHTPDAVVEGPFSYMLVDYDMLGMEMQRLN